MTKITVRYEVLSERKIKFIDREIACHAELRERTNFNKFLKQRYTTTILEQANDIADGWLREEWMEENFIDTIFDWKVIKVEDESGITFLDPMSSVEHILKAMKLDEEKLNNTLHAYGLMYDAIKHLLPYDQVHITLKAMDLGVTVGINTLKTLNNKMDDIFNEDELPEHKRLSPYYGME